ncbi:MAG TPA: hypothetical protein VGH74_06535 [Planctomycetaceae bacterium]|jgi:hypothetical protein
METYRIILAREVRNKLQDVFLRANLEIEAGLDRARATAIVNDLLAWREVAIHGLSNDEAARLIEKIRPHGIRCSIELDECPTCQSPLSRVLSRWRVWLSEKQHASISSGRAILGPDNNKPAPDCVCVVCFPEWREFHSLALQYNEHQLAKEEAVAAYNFEKARLLRNRQDELRAEMDALMDRLHGRS